MQIENVNNDSSKKTKNQSKQTITQVIVVETRTVVQRSKNESNTQKK